MSTVLGVQTTDFLLRSLQDGPPLVVNGVISFNPYKWPYIRVTGVRTPIGRIITLIYNWFLGPLYADSC